MSETRTLVVRLLTARPAPANRLAPIVHYGFYVLVVLMAGTGFATALAAGLPEIVFAGSGAPLPKSFAAYPTFQAHFWLASVLVGLIVLHVGAALHHQLVQRDGLLRRVGLGRRAFTSATTGDRLWRQERPRESPP